MPARPLLLGTDGDWPFAGHFRGAVDGAAWAGRVAAGADLDVAWRAGRTVDTALRRPGPPDADRRRALSILWTRLDAIGREGLGPAEGGDLALLLVTWDADGAAVSGVGLGAVHAVAGERVEPWVVPPHPLLGAPGLPAKRPGALTLDALPDWLVGVPAGEGGDLADAPRVLLARCGVHP